MAGKHFSDYLIMEEGKNIYFQATHKFPKNDSGSIAVKVITLHEYELLMGVILDKHLECDITMISSDEHRTYPNETLLQFDPTIKGTK